MSTKKIQIIGNIATKDDVVNIRSDISSLEVAVDGKANQSTTLDGYGITDAYTKTDGEALAERVDNAESVIAKLNGSEDGSVRKQISDAITDANLSQYAKQSELDELSTVVADKANTADLPVNVSELNNDAQYQTATDLVPLIDRVGTLESDIGTKASASELATHMVDNTNPHEVTATQTGALPITGGTLTGILYTTASTPLLIGKNGKVGLRAATEEKNNVGQINISNAWYGNGDQWGAQISAYNGQTGKYNELRVSHDGVQYNSEDDVAHTVIHDGNIDDYTAHLASTSSVNTNIDTHNTSTSAHADIRGLIAELTVKLTNFLDVDDATVDQLSEVITLINNNKGTLESLTTTKINVSDIVNDLTTNSDSKVLSAAQGVVIKTLIDTLQTELDAHTSNKSNPHEVTKAQIGLSNVPNVATNDQTPTYSEATTLDNLTSGEKLSISLGKIMKAIKDFISHKGNTSNPHGVTKAQVGLGNVDNTSDANKPISTAVQTALNAKANAVDIPTKTSQLTNDSGFKTTDNNTTYDLAASASSTNGNVKLNLTAGGSGSGTDAVSIKGSGATTVTTDSSGVITISSTDNDTKYTHPSTHAASMITGLATVATSGSYNDLSNKPTIPTKTSQLTNDSGFKTTDTNTHYTTGITTGASGTTSNSATSNPYIKIKDDSTHRSQIQIKGSGATSVSSDANGVITISSTDNNTVYTHPGSHPASMITGLATVATSGSYNDLTNKPSIPSAYTHPSTHAASMITGLATVATSGKYSDLSGKPTIPTKTSQLTNDSGFKTTDNNTTYTLATGASNGQIKVTPSSGSAYNVSVKGLGSAAYTNSTAYDASGSASNALAQAKAYTDSAISTQLGTIEAELASI